MARVRIGISGWSYRSWRGDFYPSGLPHRRELEYASRRFDSIEINGSFYSLLRPETCRAWYRETPAGFVFALKGSRFITHNKKLKDAEIPLANFFASGILLLGEKLGPIVWQLPPKLRFDEERVARFLELLPRDSREAAELASRHDARLEARSWTRAEEFHRLRHALEVRHESWFSPALVRLARRRGIALAISDSADWPSVEEVTAGFLYLRLHGSAKTYASRYDDSELDRWAERIRLWRAGKNPPDARRVTELEPPPRRSRDVYVYFDNDAAGHAPRDALRLRERLMERGISREPRDAARLLQ